MNDRSYQSFSILKNFRMSEISLCQRKVKKSHRCADMGSNTDIFDISVHRTSVGTIVNP